MPQVDRLSVNEGLRLRAIRLRAVLDAPDAFDTTFDEYTAWPDERWTAQLASPIFVAVEDGGDVGMARYEVDGRLDRTAWLVQLWVDPRARRKQIGGALVDAVIEWARLHGIARLLLDVGDRNLSAIALYRSRGFRPTGETRTMPPPREHVHEHQMELRINADEPSSAER